MPFEIYHPEPGQPQRRQGPAKLTVTHSENGRSQISLSAGTRDWLRPTPRKAGASGMTDVATMKIIILVDRSTRKLMLQRCSDEKTGEHVYVVRGFGGYGASYITGWKLDEFLGIEAGHYLCDLIPDAPDGSGKTWRAAVISMDFRVAPKRKQPTKRRIVAQPHVSLSSGTPKTDTDERRITEIGAVLGESTTVVAPEQDGACSAGAVNTDEKDR
ncbi:hypothetical protein ACFU99_01475 [Streptomyces sp. NPDC057654]|uniref:hypothetical protein n=1 Tax=Streptomyces sp. NPDC057654 TaxID=3346196 RepID=UPI0036CC37BD